MGFFRILIASIILVALTVFIVINKNIKNGISIILNFKISKKVKIKDIGVILSIIFIFFFSIHLLEEAKKSMNYFKIGSSNELMEYDEKIEIANRQLFEYNKIMEGTKTDINKCKEPYIPNGFNYKDGEWDTGFVIEDENKNQFVWVPCTNIENNDIPLLSREVFTSYSINYSSCYEEDDIGEFLNSSLQNGGFYISRYEIGNENGSPVSKENCNVWTNVTYLEAKELSEKMYSNINSKLMNGYSYDTAIKFISDSIVKEDIPETVKKTGNKSYKNIYDLVDNLR